MTEAAPDATSVSNASTTPGLWDVHQPVARRSLILCAAGALIGLGIAGVGLFTAQGTRTASVPAEDAALVNGVPILRADLVQQVTALSGQGYAQATPAQRRKVLHDMVREELYVQRGVEIGLPNDDIDVRTALVAATEGQVAQDAMTSRPSDAELRDWYASHVSDYATEGLMTLHEWLLPAGSNQGAPAADALREGRSPASLGLVSSGRVDDGEEYYFAARVHLGDTLFEAARRLADGQVSAPIVQTGRIHILQMVDNVAPVPSPFDQVKARVMQDVLEAKARHLQEGNERFLRKRADIKIASDLR